MKFNISQKLGANNFTIVFSVVSVAIYTIYILNNSNQMSLKMINQLQPSVSMLDELQSNVKTSYFLTQNVINEPSDEKRLLKFQENYKYYIKKREELKLIVDQWASDDQKIQLAITLATSDSFRLVIETIVDDVVMNKNAETAKAMFTSIEESNQMFIQQMNALHDLWIEEIEFTQTEMLSSFQILQKILYAIIIIVILMGFASFFITYQNIVVPINKLKNVVLELSKGKQPFINIKDSDDEVGEMIFSIKELVKVLKRTSNFSKSIGEGELNVDFKPLSEEDVLGNSLLTMRNNLQKVAKEEFERNWSVQGVAKFGLLLRENNHNLTLLSKEIIQNLVKYLDANQGGIFIVNEDENVLDLMSVYAFDRDKFTQTKIKLGEGLVGQCWQERESIYLTDIPFNFMEIKSGLGGATPKSVLITPLIVNEQIFGVIEIASFNELEDYQVDFVEKMGESIASTLSNVLTNIKTQRLLDESKAMTEQLQAQEEEIRQNTEEMMATQEEMQRKIQQMEGKLASKN